MPTNGLSLLVVHCKIKSEMHYNWPE